MINLSTMRSHRLASIGLLTVFFFFPSPIPSSAANPGADSSGSAIIPADVMVERGTNDTTTYSISHKDCRIEWIARDVEIGVVTHRSQCACTLTEQKPFISRIYTEFRRTDKNSLAFRTLFWGRLVTDEQNCSNELSLRLALAAHTSSGWDGRRGEAKNGDINGFVKDLANREMIYPELKELFGRFHHIINVSCVEKVLVQQADKLPYYNQLKEQGVQASDKLPFDCMIWFSIIQHRDASVIDDNRARLPEAKRNKGRNTAGPAFFCLLFTLADTKLKSGLNRYLENAVLHSIDSMRSLPS